MSRDRKNGSLITTAGALLSAMRLVCNVIERRNTIPILSCVLIDGDTLAGTDLDIEISVTVQNERADLFACVDAFQLRAIASGLDAETPVTLSRSDELIRLTFPGGAYQLMSLSPDDYQRMSGELNWRACSNWGLRDAVSRVAYAISKEETRYYLNGACLSEWPDGTPCIVATDGHRLAIADVPGASWDAGAIAPRKFLNVALALPDFSHLGMSDNLIAIRAPGVQVIGKKIAGTFPNWSRVVPPAGAGHDLAVPKAVLAAAAKRLASISTTRSRHGALFLDGDSARIGLKDGYALGLEALPGAICGGGPIEVGFNLHYILDAIKATRGEEFQLMMHDEASPASHCEDGFTGVVMPIRYDGFGVGMDGLTSIIRGLATSDA